MGISLAGDDVIEGDVVVAVLSAVDDIKVWCGPVDGLRKRDHFLKSFLWWGVVSCEDGGSQHAFLTKLFMLSLRFNFKNSGFNILYQAGNLCIYVLPDEEFLAKT